MPRLYRDARSAKHHNCKLSKISLTHIFINVFLNYPFLFSRRNYFPGFHNQTFFLQRSVCDLTRRNATTLIANGYKRKRKTYVYFGWSRTRDCSEEIMTISVGLKTSGHLDRQTSLGHLEKKKKLFFSCADGDWCSVVSVL